MIFIQQPKKQLDILFQKMKDAGYEWDSEKKQMITLNHFVDNNDMVEPKFNVGDWVVRKDDKLFNNHSKFAKIIKINKTISQPMYLVDCENWLYEDEIRLWTLSDAEEGDVLAAESSPYDASPFVAIYKERGLDCFNSHCFIGFDGIFKNGATGHSNYLIHPATKEQRDLLFQKMKDAGYEWDSVKKQLNKQRISLTQMLPLKNLKKN